MIDCICNGYIMLFCSVLLHCWGRYGGLTYFVKLGISRKESLKHALAIAFLVWSKSCILHVTSISVMGWFLMMWLCEEFGLIYKLNLLNVSTIN